MGSAHYNDVRSGWVESVNQGQGQTRAHTNLTRTDLFWRWTSLTTWNIVFSRLEGLLHFFLLLKVLPYFKLYLVRTLLSWLVRGWPNIIPLFIALIS